MAMASELRFDGRTALVTGAGRGIGRAHAALLAARGAAVVVNDLGVEMGGDGASSEPAESVVREITRAGGLAIASQEDVSDPDGAQRAVRMAVETFGSLDVVVNNAGIVRYAAFSDLQPSDLRRMFAVHVEATWQVCHAAWPHLAARRLGRIVNTTSAAGLYGISNGAHYAAAKGAIIGLTRALAIEGRALGVHVNALSPIAFTRMAEASQFPESRERLRHTAPAEDIAAAAAWLTHDSCELTGRIWQVGAGRCAEIVIAEAAGVSGQQLSPESVRASEHRISDRAELTVHEPNAGAPGPAASASMP
jgi:NAD(P)-dependent dehydrogenase (short-subunit alcohol dehydrogenase family)